MASYIIKMTITGYISSQLHRSTGTFGPKAIIQLHEEIYEKFVAVGESEHIPIRLNQNSQPLYHTTFTLELSIHISSFNWHLEKIIGLAIGTF